MRQWRRRCGGERGASAVEAALVTPVVVAMLVGIVELGMVFKDYLGATSMATSGVRMASAAPRVEDFGLKAAAQMRASGTATDPRLVTELWVFRAGTSNAPLERPTTCTSATKCIPLTWDATAGRFVYGTSAGPNPSLKNNWPHTAQNACGLSVPGGSLDRVGVYVNVRHDFLTGFVFGSSLDIKETKAMNLEPYPAADGCKGTP